MRDRNLTRSDNWQTPPDLYDRLNEEFDFDFDPCPLNIGEITPDVDGLLIEWGQRNFVNPPYSRSLKESFINRSLEFANEGRLCVLLIPASVSTAIFHDVIKTNAAEIRFIRGRVKFINANGGKTSGGMHDSMIVVFDGRNKKTALLDAAKEPNNDESTTN